MADLSAPDLPGAALPGPDLPPDRAAVSAWIIAAGAFLGAAALSLAVGWGLAELVEVRTAEVIRTRMLTEGYAWAHVETDGLIVSLTGTAPTEAQRFAAVNLAGTVVDSGRLRDGFEVEPAKVLAPPRFSVEMLRNDDGVQLIGLLPEGEDRATLTAAASTIKSIIPPMDMLETASYPAPEGWQAALTFGMTALELLPRAKISIAAEGVTIVAIAGSDAEKRQFEAALTKAAPKGLQVTTEISAPRPVLTPFTLRFVIDAKGARFDACSADTEVARTRILAAATKAGAKGDLSCTIGMGVPSPSWAEATSDAIVALAALGAGTVTFSDADITLLAGETVTQAKFDRAIGELRAALPDVFSLDARMPEKVAASQSQGPVEFTAKLDGKTHRAELRGRLGDDRMQAAVASFAKARFGADKVYVATLPDPALPDGWTQRVLAGLQALSALDSGQVLVRPDTVEVSGISGLKTASDTVSQVLSERLGQGKTFKVDVSYDKALDPMADLPTPQECLERVQTVQAARKITFDPGSAEIDAASGAVMDALAQAFKNCTGIKIEIGGHTDAQGSTTGNLALSQARAEAVLVALQGRQVDVSGMRAVGYGEGVPIADNGSEAGRETNRRIEFTLIGGAIGDVPGGSLAAMLDQTTGAAQGQAALHDPAIPAAPASDATPAPSAPVVETAEDGTPLAPEESPLKPKNRPKP